MQKARSKNKRWFAYKTETIIDIKAHDFSPFISDIINLMNRHKNTVYLSRWDDGPNWSYTKICLDCMHRFTVSHGYSGYRNYKEEKLPDCYGSECEKIKCEEYYSCIRFKKIMNKCADKKSN